MDSSRKQFAASRTWLTVAALAALASLVLASSALGGTDPLKGGSVTFQLKKSRGLSFKPKSATLKIKGGDLDPITGEGSVDVTGGFKARTASGKVKVTILTVNFGPNGKAGTIAAKIRKQEIEGFGSVSGGKTTRDGFGAKITGVTAKISSKGLRALSKGKKKGASAAKAVPLGTISAETIPKTVEVVPGSGFIVLHTEPSLLPKFAAHCIDATPPPGAAGAFPIAPAVQDPLPNPVFRFPVTGGSVAPDLSDGKVITGGGQGLTKNNGPLTLPYAGACASTPPTVGATVTNANFEAQLNLKALASFTTLPTGPVGVGSTAVYSGGTQSFDANTKTLTFTGVTLRFDPLAAFVVGQVFPNVSGDPANDFRGGDLLGMMDVTAKVR